MDNYLYILVGIVWVIINLYKAVQKKESENKQTGSERKPAEEKKKNIETIFRELLERHSTASAPETIIPKQKISIPSRIKKQITPSYPKTVAVDEESLGMGKNNEFSYEALSDQTTNSNNIFQPVHLVVTEEGEILFDAKNAILYSEIIAKPKYLSDI